MSLSELELNKIRISTITFNSKIHVKDQIDLSLRESFDRDIFTECVESSSFMRIYRKERKRQHSRTRKTKKRVGEGFFNQTPICVTLNKDNIKLFEDELIKIYSKDNVDEFIKTLDIEKFIHIKFFKNCSLTLTGPVNNIEADASVILLLNEINKYEKNVFIENGDKLTFKKCTISMVNSDFKMNLKHKINREVLRNLIRDKYNAELKAKKYSVNVNYEPSLNYQGVNIEYHSDKEKISSILVFASGAIIITGVKSETIEKCYKKIIESFNFIKNIIDSNIEELKLEINEEKPVKVPQKRGRKPKNIQPATTPPADNEQTKSTSNTFTVFSAHP